MHFLQDLSGLGSIWLLTLTRITMCETFSTPRNGLVPTGPRYDQFATSPGQERWWLIHTDWWCWQLRHWNSTGWHWDSHRWNWCPKIYRNPWDLTANMGFWGVSRNILLQYWEAKDDPPRSPQIHCLLSMQLKCTSSMR